MAEKKGNVVLIEAFVVLCLLFMLQYVVAGVAERSNESHEDGVYIVTLTQSQSDGDVTSHFDAVRIDGHLLMMDGKNCPPIATPSAYRFIKRNGRMEAFDISTTERTDLNVAADNDLKIFRDLVASSEIQVTPYQPGQADGPANAAGWGILLTGKLRSLQKMPLVIEAFVCTCYLKIDSIKGSKFDFPHPILATVTTISDSGQLTRNLVGYNHNSEVNQDAILALRSGDIDMKPSIRRFSLTLTSKGSVTWEQFNSVDKVDAMMKTNP